MAASLTATIKSVVVLAKEGMALRPRFKSIRNPASKICDRMNENEETVENAQKPFCRFQY